MNLRSALSGVVEPFVFVFWTCSIYSVVYMSNARNLVPLRDIEYDSISDVSRNSSLSDLSYRHVYTLFT